MSMCYPFGGWLQSGQVSIELFYLIKCVKSISFGMIE